MPLVELALLKRRATTSGCFSVKAKFQQMAIEFESLFCHLQEITKPPGKGGFFSVEEQAFRPALQALMKGL